MLTVAAGQGREVLLVPELSGKPAWTMTLKQFAPRPAWPTAGMHIENGEVSWPKTGTYAIPAAQPGNPVRLIFREA